MARARDRLYRRNRYHSNLDRTTGAYSLQLMQQKPRGGAQGTALGLVPPVQHSGNNRHTGLSLKIRLTRGHTHTSMNRSRRQ